MNWGRSVVFLAATQSMEWGRMKGAPLVQHNKLTVAEVWYSWDPQSDRQSFFEGTLIICLFSFVSLVSFLSPFHFPLTFSLLSPSLSTVAICWLVPVCTFWLAHKEWRKAELEVSPSCDTMDELWKKCGNPREWLIPPLPKSLSPSLSLSLFSFFLFLFLSFLSLLN